MKKAHFRFRSAFLVISLAFSLPAIAGPGVAEEKKSSWYTPEQIEAKKDYFGSYQRGWLKDDFLVRQIHGNGADYEIYPEKARPLVREWDYYNDRVEALAGEIRTLEKEVANHKQFRNYTAKAFDEMEQRLASAKKEIDLAKAEKAAVFKDGAEDVAKLLKRRAKDLGDMWKQGSNDLAWSKYPGQEYLKSKPAAFTATEKEVKDLANKLGRYRVAWGVKVGGRLKAAGAVGAAALVVAPLAVEAYSHEGKAEELPAVEPSAPAVGASDAKAEVSVSDLGD